MFELAPQSMVPGSYYFVIVLQRFPKGPLDPYQDFTIRGRNR